MTFSTEALAPAIGTVVTGLDLAKETSVSTMKALIHLLFERGVLVIRNQTLDDREYDRFARFWGQPLEFFIPEHRNEQFPSIIRISNDPATPLNMRDGAVHWHSDSSYETIPATVTMLYGKEAPLVGGETHFANTIAAYADLPEETKARLDGLIASHELGRAPWIEGETVPDPSRPRRATDAPRHPLIMTHPVTGRKAIFTSGTAYAIDGIEEAEATELIRQLRAHIVRPQYRTSYKVEPGDLVLWDNFSTVHCASPIEYSNDEGKKRLLYRISTKGIPALCQ